MYDAVVIGGGLSGLSALYKLRGLKTLLIEKESYLGGRVKTESFNGINFDLGAVLAYDPRYLPFSISQKGLLKEDGKIGFFWRGRLYTGDSVISCLKSSLPKSYLDSIEMFIANDFSTNGLGNEVKKILNAFFRVIHPGDMEDYIPERRRDAFNRYYPKHYPKGNFGLVEEFLARVSAEILTCSEAVSIRKNKDSFRVEFFKDGKREFVVAASVVVATRASEALSLIPWVEEKHLKLLNSIDYGMFTVFAMGVKGLVRDISYVVSTEPPVNTLYFMNFPKEDVCVLIFYICHRESIKLEGRPEKEIAELCTDFVKRLGIATGKTLFFAAKRWKLGGTVISDWVYSLPPEGFINPYPGLFLVGDYTFKPFPYGMEPAVISGLKGGERAYSFLKGDEG